MRNPAAVCCVDTTGWTKVPGGSSGEGILQWTGSGAAPVLDAGTQVAIRNALGFAGGGSSSNTSIDLSGLGGMGGGETSVTSTSTTDIPDWLKPYASQFLNYYQGLVQKGMQGLPNNLNQRVAPFSQQQIDAMKALSGDVPAAQARVSDTGADQLRATLSGQYLNPSSNPYLRATYEAAARPMEASYQYATAPSTMASAQLAGQMGGSAYKELDALNRYGLGRNLDELATSIYGGNYQAERQRQAAGQAFIPGTMDTLGAPAKTTLGAGAYNQAQQQVVNDTNFANALRGWEFPLSLLSGYGGAISQAGGGTGSSSSTSNIPAGFLSGAGGSSGGVPGWLTPTIAGLGGLSGLGGLVQGARNISSSLSPLIAGWFGAGNTSAPGGGGGGTWV